MLWKFVRLLQEVKITYSYFFYPNRGLTRIVLKDSFIFLSAFGKHQ